MTADPTHPLPERWNAQGSPGPPSPARGRRRRWPIIIAIRVVVILLLLAVADQVAKAYTENQIASQFQSSVGLSGKPRVTIQDSPFLPQLISRDFHTVNITASNETIPVNSAVSGLLKVASLNATLHGMHIHGLNSATVDQFSATALITFTALGNVGGIPSGITMTADGPNQIKTSFNVLGFFSDTATVRVTQSGPNQINVKVIDAGWIPSDVLGNLANFSVSLPKLPARVTVQSVSVTPRGVQITITGRNTTLGKQAGRVLAPTATRRLSRPLPPPPLCSSPTSAASTARTKKPPASWPSKSSWPPNSYAYIAAGHSLAAQEF